MKLVFATHNKGKLLEVQKIIGNSIEIISLDDINCYEDIEETGSTFAENAHLKAQHIKEKYGYDCFADDSGLEVKSLDNQPGIYSARYAGKENNSEKNMSKLLSELEGKEDRTAQFKTVIVLYISDKKYEFEGVCKGAIATQKRGTNGFGYDPIFIPENYKESFAEISAKEKSRISHRGKAMEKLISFLNKK